MSIVKAIVGAVIGAVIATAVLVVLRDGNLRGYEWFPIVTGLLTGLGARVLTGGQAVAGGAVAAVVSLLAILAGDELVALWKYQNADLGPIARLSDAARQGTPKAEPKADDAPANEEAPGDLDDVADDDASDEDDDSEGASGADMAAVDAARAEEAAGREASMRETANSARGDALSGDAQPPRKRPRTWKDFAPYVFSGLGVLVAYQMGRGSNRTRVTSESEREDRPTYEEAT